IFGVSWTLSTQLNNLKQESSKQEAQIAQFAEIEFKVLGLSDKSAALTTILAQRDYFSLGLSAVIASLPSNLKVTGFDAQKDKDTVTINGETSSYVTLASFLQNLVDTGKGGVLFTDAALSSVNLNSATGTAEFIIEATIQKNGLKKPLSSEEGE
ncbi:MAG: PilN domain-containing protein, partial [candidate division WWE3 bacterium]|nr:PilN domain-containing protein [candidate division WWE3 bacterium]